MGEESYNKESHQRVQTTGSLVKQASGQWCKYRLFSGAPFFVWAVQGSALLTQSSFLRKV